MKRWYPNKGTAPNDKSAEVAVVWANRSRARHTYKVGQLIWALRGWTHDIGWFAKADAVPATLPFDMEQNA